MIRTPHGDIAVQDLTLGDLVLTLDHWQQPVRWIGQRTVPATGKMAPIALDHNAIGPHDALLRSLQHRVLIRNTLATLLFGEDDVLVADPSLRKLSVLSRLQAELLPRHAVPLSPLLKPLEAQGLCKLRAA